MKHRILSRDEETELGRRARGGDLSARDCLVLHNRRFAAKMALRYKGHGLDEDELMSAATLGLLEAANRFDERRGFRFISYAVYWVRHEIQDALARNNPVRLPSSRIAKLSKLRAAQERAEQERLREVSLEATSGLSVRQFADLAPILGSHIELDAPTDEPFEIAASTPDLELRHRINSVLGLLYPREREIIELHYGLRDGEPRTYQTVADIVGLSRERVRQIEMGALERLRRG